MDREDLINGYFEGKLDKAQQQHFGQLLRQDQEFAEEFAFREKVQQAIHLQERDNLKNKLRSFELKGHKPAKNIGIRRWISAVAAILIVGVATIWWYHQSSTEQLYRNYFETFPNIVQPLVRSEIIDSKRSAAFLSYDRGDYQKSAVLFAQAGDATGLFYGALSEMELGEHQKAAKIFESIKPSSTELGQYVMWYKSLNLLKLGRRIEATAIITQLEKEKDFELAGKVLSLKRELSR